MARFRRRNKYIFFYDEGDRYENTEKGQVIAHYNSLEELVEDGWVLD
ncbi:MAG: hypothetical protein IJ161_07395 [Bacteroidales bacterium]|nr:hypothetical protein [Bacteroidales bacterium]